MSVVKALRGRCFLVAETKGTLLESSLENEVEGGMNIKAAKQALHINKNMFNISGDVRLFIILHWILF